MIAVFSVYFSCSSDKSLNFNAALWQSFLLFSFYVDDCRTWLCLSPSSRTWIWTVIMLGGKITCLSCVNKSVFGPSRAYARARALQNYTFCFHNLHTFPFNTLWISDLRLVYLKSICIFAAMCPKWEENVENRIESCHLHFVLLIALKWTFTH